MHGLSDIVSIFFHKAEYNDPSVILSYGHYKYDNLDGRYGGKVVYDAYSSILADLKAANESAVERFSRLLAPRLAKGFTVVVVPPHTATPVVATGIARLAAALTEGGRCNGVGCLFRHTEVPPLGGASASRTLQAHLDTIGAGRLEAFRGRGVLLLDDLAVTANSINACALLLEDAGARDVQRLVLARVDPQTIRRAVPSPIRRSPAHQPLEPKREHPTWKPGISYSRYWSSNGPAPGETPELPGRLRNRRSVVDDAPGPKYFDMVRKYGTPGRDK